MLVLIWVLLSVRSTILFSTSIIVEVVLKFYILQPCHKCWKHIVTILLIHSHHHWSIIARCFNKMIFITIYCSSSTTELTVITKFISTTIGFFPHKITKVTRQTYVLFFSSLVSDKIVVLKKHRGIVQLWLVWLTLVKLPKL